MLNQNAYSDAISAAALTRVTAQELAQAAASIEARQAAEQHAEQHRLSTTIPLGEAVQQLDLSATPEELLQEIHSLRSRQASETSLSRKNRQGLGTLLGLLAALGCYFTVTFSLLIGRQNTEASVVSPSITPAAPTITIKSADTVSEGQPMYCDFETLQDFGRGRGLKQIHVATSSQAPDNFWTLRKQGGKVFVEAWGNLENLLRAENGHSADIYANDNRANDPDDTRMMRMLPAERFRDAESMHTSGGSTDEVNLHPLPSL